MVYGLKDWFYLAEASMIESDMNSIWMDCHEQTWDLLLITLCKKWSFGPPFSFYYKFFVKGKLKPKNLME